MSKVYIISGTLGAGKSTVAKLLAEKLHNAALVSADIFMDDMLPNKQNPSWDERLKFVWDNTTTTAQNALKLGLDVVIEGVVENELPQLKEAFQEHDLYYCILFANPEALATRIKDRGDEHLIKRSNEVLDQYKTDAEKQPFMLDTSDLSPEQVLDHILQLQPLS